MAAIELALSLPQFGDMYDGLKMRNFVDEIERLHAALTVEDGSITAGVDSFATRTGAVVPETGDYSAFYSLLGHGHSNFTDVAPGFAPLSGGGTTNFLRADGTWAAPGGGATVVAGTVQGEVPSWDTGNTQYEVAFGVLMASAATPSALDQGYITLVSGSTVDVRQPQIFFQGSGTTNVSLFWETAASSGFYLRNIANGADRLAFGREVVSVDSDMMTFREDGSIRTENGSTGFYLTTQGSAGADYAGWGQLWNRFSDDALMYTDENGTDFVLNGTGAAGGTVQQFGTPVSTAVAVWGTPPDLEGADSLRWSSNTLQIFEATVAESIDLYTTLTQANFDIAAGSNLNCRNGTESFWFGTANGAFSAYYNGTLTAQTADNSIAGRLTGWRTYDHSLAFKDVGLALSEPQVNPTGFTLGGDAALETTIKTNTTAFTITCEGSGTNNFPIGASHPFWNRGASGDITIADGSETLIYLDGSSATDVGASMTCGPGGAGEIYRESATVYLVTGTGLTA